MAGNRTGGLKTAETNKSKDPDYYKKIGAKGGASHNRGGFYYAMTMGETWHIEAGRKGGLVASKRSRNGD